MNINIRSIFISSFLGFSLFGCQKEASYTPLPISKYSDPAVACKLPQEINLTISVHDFIVKGIRLDTLSPCLPNGVRFTERQYNGIDVFFKFSPIKRLEGEDFYLSRIPAAKTGNPTIKAYLYSTNYQQIGDPPSTFPVSGNIVDGYVDALTISDLSWSPGGFKTRGGGQIDGDTVIVDVESNNYPGALWSFRVPRVDGVFTTLAKQR